MSWLEHWSDREWLRVHLDAHVIGGALRVAKWVGAALALLTGHPFVACWIVVVAEQLEWELMQREYTREVGRVYPWWSVVGDVILTAVGAGAVLVPLSLWWG